VTLRESATVEITFDRGVPTAINGVDMRLTDLIESLSTIGNAQEASSARAVLDAAHEELRKLGPVGSVPAPVSGLVRLEFAGNAWRIVAAEQLVGQELGV